MAWDRFDSQHPVHDDRRRFLISGASSALLAGCATGGAPTGGPAAGTYATAMREALRSATGALPNYQFRSSPVGNFGVGSIYIDEIAGNDLRDMKPEIREILTQKEVIAVDQDPLGLQGRRVRKNGDLEVWSKALQDGSRAVILFNRGTASGEVSVSWQDLGYPAHLTAKVRDLWQAKDLGEYKGTFSATVAPHSVVMVTVKP